LAQATSVQAAGAQAAGAQTAGAQAAGAQAAGAQALFAFRSSLLAVRASFRFSWILAKAVTILRTGARTSRTFSVVAQVAAGAQAAGAQAAGVHGEPSIAMETRMELNMSDSSEG